MKLGEAMYRAQQAEGSAQPQGGHDAPGKDDVIDAEFKDVSGDDHKK